jgi:hypothetical protein
VISHGLRDISFSRAAGNERGIHRVNRDKVSQYCESTIRHGTPRIEKGFDDSIATTAT